MRSRWRDSLLATLQPALAKEEGCQYICQWDKIWVVLPSSNDGASTSRPVYSRLWWHQKIFGSLQAAGTHSLLEHWQVFKVLSDGNSGGEKKSETRCFSLQLLHIHMREEKRSHKNVITLDPWGSVLYYTKASAINPHLCLSSRGSWLHKTIAIAEGEESSDLSANGGNWRKKPLRS